MRKIALTLFFALFFAHSATAFDIQELSFSPVDNTVLTYATTDNKTLIYRVSFMSCGGGGVTSFGYKAKAVALSRYDSAYLFLADNKSIVIYNRFKSKEKRVATELSSNITNFIQDNDGKYIVATDGKSLALYKFANETLSLEFKKDFLDEIGSIIIDSDKGQLFTVEKTGVISAWSFRGRILRVNNTKKPILKAIDMGIEKNIAYLTRDGVFTIDYDLRNLKPLIKIRATDIFYDRYGSSILVKSGGNLKFYDINTGEAGTTIKVEDKKIFGVIGKNILTTVTDNYAFFYDSKTGVEAGAIKYSDNSLLFQPPAERPALFAQRSGDSRAKGDIYPVNNARVCAPFTALITGVYLAKRDKVDFAIDRPKYKPTNTPTNPDNLTNLREVEIPEVDNITPPKQPAVAKATIGKEYVKTPNEPKVNEPTPPQKRFAPRSKEVTNKARLLADSDIPVWIINRNRLDDFEVVRSGVTEEDAMQSAKKEIKNRILKYAMTLALDEKSIGKVADVEVKKRLLWSIASTITLNQEHKITAKDRWTSSNGQSYVLMNFNKGGVSDVFKNIYDIEFEKLMKLGNKKYMELKPNIIE